MNFFGSLSSAGKTGEKNPEDIPKDELVHLCMKMNKRMQAMEAKGKELVRQKSRLVEERKLLLELMQSSVQFRTLATDDSDLDLPVIEAAWKDWQRSNHEHVTVLEEKIIASEQIFKQRVSAIEAKHRKEIAMLQSLPNPEKETNESGNTLNTANSDIEALIQEKNVRYYNSSRYYYIRSFYACSFNHRIWKAELLSCKEMICEKIARSIV